MLEDIHSLAISYLAPGSYNAMWFIHQHEYCGNDWPGAPFELIERVVSYGVIEFSNFKKAMKLYKKTKNTIHTDMYDRFVDADIIISSKRSKNLIVYTIAKNSAAKLTLFLRLIPVL